MADKLKYVTIKGRQYQIRLFSARYGSFIVVKVGGLLGPVAGPFLNSLGGKNLTALKPEDFDLEGINLGAMLAPLANISEEDFLYLQDKALSVCRVKLDNGTYGDVLNDNGSVSVEDLEDDSSAVMALMVHALMFNLGAFFGGGALMGLVGAIQASNSQNSQT